MPAAIGKTVVGKALGTVIPYVGPIIAGIQILSSLFGDDGENERLEAQVAIENAREQQRLQAEEQARQSLKQQCEFLAEDVITHHLLDLRFRRGREGLYNSLPVIAVANHQLSAPISAGEL